MSVTKILSIVFLIISLGLAWYLGSSIKHSIDERKLIAQRENAIIEKLKLIREAEIVFQEVNGNYTSDWNKLIDFIKNGEVPIIEKKETIITLDYGADSVVVEFDTLEIIPAKERIFRQSHSVLAANDGVFRGFELSVGQMAEQGNVAYRLLQSGKVVEHKFKESGEVTNTQPIQSGQRLTKGDLLMTLVETKFDPNTNLDRLMFVPGYENVQFEIYADEVTKGNVQVDVIEVRNTKPFDPNRSESNDATNKKPLRFGSRTDVTTAGNWE
ncbi:hypothetical protein [Fulvivirga sedimenti]|uniref:Uncharacterized protein n=1 Tax=Fulvivirga sedimenti TaxID=2879465 RepID=A0A9X1KX53_9BACT|nr:hypothetical protein [Fulvivirga sedimenti]MCA6073892.1 hypothetical protein [Fulvivirga sedimenti]